MLDEKYVTQFYQSVAAAATAQSDPDLKYFVDIDDSSVRGEESADSQMSRVIQRSAGTSTTQVLCGPRGSGKSTELIKLGRDAMAHGRAYVRIDMESLLSPAQPLSPGLLLPSIAAAFLREVVQQVPVESIGAQTWWSRLKKSFDRIHLALPDRLGSGSVSVGPMSFELPSFIDIDPSQREIVERAMRQNRATVRAELHALISEAAIALRGRSPLTPLLVIDSLEHWRGWGGTYATVRDSVISVFVNDRDDLELPNLHTVYCAPAYVQDRVPWPVFRLYCVKTQERDGTPCEEGLEALHRVLAQRAPGGDSLSLFASPDLERKAILASGGFFRSLFEVLTRVLLMTDAAPVTEEQLLLATREAGRRMTGDTITAQRGKILRAVLRHQSPGEPPYEPGIDDMADYEDLQSIGAILRYSNGEDWMGVHPLLVPLIERESSESHESASK
ncbi:MAG: hypothetical protein LBV00_13285 [Propionibacteriaceae bacterium]|jgi:hypothetical protein|nr:hypothetical protein [Propionibacteriaceae bacterium]